MDQAWMSLQHPYTHQHLQQHQRQYLKQQHLPSVGSAARVILYIPKRRAAETYIQLPFSSLPEARFNSCLLSPIQCPQMAPLHQTHYAEEVYVGTTANVTTASQWTEAHACSGGQGSMSCIKEDQKNKTHKDNPGNEANAGNEDKTPKDNIPADLTEDCDRPGPPASLDEEAVNKDSFEQCFRLLESFFDQLPPDEAEEPREEEHGEAGYLNKENSSFLEYLDELCRDEDYVSKVEATVNIEVLMSLLSASQDLFEEQRQEMILQEALPPSPANSDYLHGETPPVSSQLLFLDPPGSHFGSNPNQNEQNSSQKEVGISCSPLPPSYLLEDLPVKSNFSDFEKTQELNKPRKKGGEKKTLGQDARKENLIKVKPYPFVNLGHRVDKERKKLQEKHTQACQATRKRGRSADSTGTEMEQLGPSPPPKKAAKSKRR